MKKIISGRKYDTNTATLVGQWSNGYYGSDFQYEGEELYRKRNGEFFLYGEGNAMSRYAESRGNNSWGGGWRIIPLSYDAARQWAEDKLDADEYESVFGEVSEDEAEDVVLSVRVSARARTLLDRMAAQSGTPKGELVERAIGMLDVQMHRESLGALEELDREWAPAE